MLLTIVSQFSLSPQQYKLVLQVNCKLGCRTISAHIEPLNLVSSGESSESQQAPRQPASRPPSPTAALMRISCQSLALI